MKATEAPTLGTGLAGVASERIKAIRARPRAEYEAGAFYHDVSFRLDAVKLMPGEYFVHDADDLLLTTVLGSCVSVCLIDRVAHLGGMNHFMLPDGGSAGRYGVYAMELLINGMMKRGARRERLQAKVFGGGHVMSNFSTINVGEQNVAFIDQFLASERIPVLSRDVLDIYPRKVCLFPGSGRALVKKLAAAQATSIASQEAEVRGALSRKPAQAAAGSVELF